MDQSTLSRSTTSSRLTSSVSTRAMSRLASATSTSTSSSLTRPTLSSSRKVSTTLKRSATGLGAGPVKRRIKVHGDDSPKDTSTSSSSSSGTGKRKAVDEGGITKKVRLYSPESRKLLPIIRATDRPISAPKRLIPSTPQRSVSSKSNGKWIHPLAHTPNRVQAHLTPPGEGNSFSSDEMLLGDSPIARSGFGDTPMKSVQELRGKSGSGNGIVRSRSLKREKAWLGPENESMRDQGLETSDIKMDVDMGTSVMSEEDCVMGDNMEDSFDSPPRTLPTISTATKHTPPTLNPTIRFSTTPPHPPPCVVEPQTTSPINPLPKPSSSVFTARPNPSTSLAPPPTSYTIAASPRKGLSSISRFGVAKKPPPATTGTDGQPTISQFLSRPADVVHRPVNKATIPSISAPRVPSPSEEDMEIDPSIPKAPKTTLPILSSKVPPASLSRGSDMLPPSRIPLRPSAPPKSTTVPPSTGPPGNNSKRSALGGLGVAAHRPLSRSTTTSLSLSTLSGPNRPPTPAEEPIRRKPSYPSTLGSGPLPRPRDRQISVPVPAHIIEPILREVPREPLRSVSAPAPRDNLPPTERQSLSLSTRREGWMDTSRSLHGLSEALERLKVKKDVPVVEPTRRPSLAASTSSARSSLAMTGVVDPEKENLLMKNTMAGATSGRLSAVHKSRYSVTGGQVSGAVVNGSEIETEKGDKSLAAIVSSTSGSGCLKGVVAFVDVWTADGTDSSVIFADMLRSLGARVLSRPSDSCTHIIYKSGRSSTLNWYRKQKQLEEEDPECKRPHIVGLSWVTRSKEAGKRLEEGKYTVDIGDEDVFSKRRKSMEPKSLSLAALSSSVGPGQGRSVSTLSGIAEAKRKSLIFAPKVGSPLKKGHKQFISSDDDM